MATDLAQTADATGPADPTRALPKPIEKFMQLPPAQRMGMLVGVAALVAVLVGGILWTRPPEYGVLYTNVSGRDGGEIIAALEQMNVPFKMSPGGGAILVPPEQVHDVRLRLAAQGLPKGGLVGFEVMENQRLGASQFLEQVNYQRALEGELARSIQTLAAVSAARVHLAIPKQSAFVREEQKPSASVLLNLQPGRSIEPGQVAGIVHLVASSVPHLLPSAVTVVDQNGNLLSEKKEPRENGLDEAQTKYLREMESSFTRRIEAILEPIVGPGNSRAQVTADLDFSQAEKVAESYSPNQGADKSAIRSQQSSESNSTGSNGPGGVPGALSNQPPVPATAPVTQPQQGANGQTTVTPPSSSRKDATVNYEVDKTITHVRQPMGQIRRLSVAVVVNHRKDVAADGTVTSKALTQEQLDQISALVKETVGFSADRGDSLNVANAPFNLGEKEVIPELPLWKQPEMIALAKEVAKYLGIGIVALWIFFGMIRPAVKRMNKPEKDALNEIQPDPALPPPSGEGAEGLTGEEAANTAQLNYEAKLQKLRDAAHKDPKAVANVIKEWAGSNP